MVTLAETIEPLVGTFWLAVGLERRFPANNGPFAYGTRLCEEIGELAEAITTNDPHQTKEAQDVLQIVMGIANRYDCVIEVATATPHTPENITAIDIVIAAGKLADAINHAESQGIKRQKHTLPAAERVLNSAIALAHLVIQYLANHQLLIQLQRHIEADFTTMLGARHIVRDEAMRGIMATLRAKHPALNQDAAKSSIFYLM